jgi:phosphoserine phosphatase
MYVLTLVASALTPGHVAAARGALQGAGAPRWLAQGRACDVPFGAPQPLDAEAAVREALAGAPVDLLAQPAAGRRKRLLVADMDSTIITVECIDEMADMLGLKPQIAAITEAAMRGELDFPSALRRRVGLLRGLEVAALERVCAERVRLMPGAAALVRTMAANGAYAALVSGGFRFFTGRVRQAAGFHADRANELAVADGRLTGEVVEPILGSDAKLATLAELTAARGLQPSQTLALGDGANDLQMIRQAGLGVAYHAKPVVAAAARARVDHNDLTAVLYFQGYSAGEFIAAPARSPDGASA